VDKGFTFLVTSAYSTSTIRNGVDHDRKWISDYFGGKKKNNPTANSVYFYVLQMAGQPHEKASTWHRWYQNVQNWLLGTSESSLTWESSGTVTSPYDGSKLSVYSREYHKNGELVEAVQRLKQNPSPDAKNQQALVVENVFPYPTHAITGAQVRTGPKGWFCNIL
jgi:hypothetical protein